MKRYGYQTDADGDVVLTMTGETHDRLLMVLGAYTALAHAIGTPISSPDCLRLVNTLEKGNPQYRPYNNIEDPPNLVCPNCRKRTYHLKDIEEGYCGFCHSWTTPSTISKR